jgi:predicted Zn-dependent protease
MQVAKRLDQAKALAHAGEVTAARTIYAELADDPRARAKANTALAELEYREGNYNEAIARANAAMRAGVAVPAFFVRALAELKGDKPADAARDFQKVLNIEPANSDAKEGLRRAEEQMRRKP